MSRSHALLCTLLAATCTLVLSAPAARAMEQPHFSGTAYYDYLWVLQGFNGQADSSAFQFRRVYFTYDQVLSSTASWRLRLEAQNEDHTEKGRMAPFVKQAFVRLDDAVLHGTLFVGLTDAPHLGTTERIWGYRSVEKSELDYRGFAGSTDMGVALTGAFGSSRNVEYHVMVANGTGTKTEDNVQKRAYATLRMLPGANTFEVAADYEGQPGRSDVFLARALLGCEGHSSAAQIEFFHRSVRGATPADPSINSLGASATVRGMLTRKVAGFARADYFNPSADDRGDNYHEGLVIAGVDWRLGAADVHIVPNMEMVLYDAPRAALERDADIVARITLVANVR